MTQSEWRTATNRLENTIGDLRAQLDAQRKVAANYFAEIERLKQKLRARPAPDQDVAVTALSEIIKGLADDLHVKVVETFEGLRFHADCRDYGGYSTDFFVALPTMRRFNRGSCAVVEKVISEITEDFEQLC